MKLTNYNEETKQKMNMLLAKLWLQQKSEKDGVEYVGYIKDEKGNRVKVG